MQIKTADRPVKFDGLDANKKYAAKEITLYSASAINQCTIFSGDFLINVGIIPNANLGRTSVVLKIEEVK